MNKFFLYGGRNAGKSTLVDKVIGYLGITPSGFKTISDSSDVKGDWNLYIADANAKNPTLTERNRAACCKADGSFISSPEVFDRLGV